MLWFRRSNSVYRFPGSDLKAATWGKLLDLAGVFSQSADEGISRLVYDRERAIVARHDCVEVKEFPAGHRRNLAAHRETISDRHDPDHRTIDLVDQGHVGKNVGITHVIKHFLSRHLDDHTVRIAKIDRFSLTLFGRRMHCVGEREFEGTGIDHAAGVHGIDVFDALPRRPHADLEIRDQLCTGLLQDFNGIANVIVVTMGQHHMGHSFGNFFCRQLFRKRRISRQERIDQDQCTIDLDLEGRVAVPCQFHVTVSPLSVFADPTNRLSAHAIASFTDVKLQPFLLRLHSENTEPKR